MQNEKLQINFGENNGTAQLIIREGKAKEILPELAPIKTDITGLITAPAEFLRKRQLDKTQIDPMHTHVLVDRDDNSIVLVMQDDDPYNRGFVIGRLYPSIKFRQFGINEAKGWEPNALGQFFKMNRAFFQDKAANMALVAQLKNFEATINSKLEKQQNEKGDFKDSYSGTVMSNLPDAFNLTIPIFSGMEPETIEVEFYATINGREVQLQLVSPGAEQLIQELRDQIIDDQIKAICDIEPLIAIIEQ